MKFKPSLLPIGIGSLPHVDPYEACRIILNYFPESPYWPQLPLRSPKEGMLVQFTEGMPGFVMEDEKFYFNTPFNPNSEWERFYEVYFNEDLDYFKTGEQYASGLHTLLRLLKDRRPIFVKGQITGPITLGLGISDEKKIPILYDPNLREMILKSIAMKAKWQETQFRNITPDSKSIIFFDEPLLSSYGSISMNLGSNEIIEYLKKSIYELKDLSGIHICGATDWSIIMKMGINVIHFDAYRFFPNMLAYTKELKEFLLSGGAIGWGIVPSEEEYLKVESLSTLIANFEEKIDLLFREGIPFEILLENSFISQSCGLSSLSEELAEKALKLTSELSKKLREKFKLLGQYR